MIERKAISQRLRFEVFKRDDFVCQYCGRHPPEVILHADHILAVANGGGNEMDNLVTSCAECNQGKGARSLQQIPQSLSDRAAEIEEREAQLAGYEAVLARRRKRIDDDVEFVEQIFREEFPKMEFAIAGRRSVRGFVERLGKECVAEALELALGSRARGNPEFVFKYFCGVCWNWIKEGKELPEAAPTDHIAPVPSALRPEEHLHSREEDYSPWAGAWEA